MAISFRLRSFLRRGPAAWAGLVGFVGLVSSGLAAPAPREFSEAERRHWAYQPVVRPGVPPVRSTSWPRTPVDAFILAGLEAHGLRPASPAEPAVLLRRASLTLTGLPPSPQALEDYLADTAPGAWARAVDRLLASPQYGERWARHWLDLARYADSEGFKNDETRPHAWRYRDYVIQSLNDDKPYDRFVQEQIAGDELWPGDPAASIATAFNRHYADESNARNLMQRRQEILNDITDTVGSVFLGLTYGCARCHDHKYDPIRQADYYRLQAFFAHTAARDDLVLSSTEAVQRHRAQLAVWEEKTRAIRERMEALEAPRRRALERDHLEKYPAEVQAAWNKPEAARTPFERQMAWKARQYLDPNSHEYIAAPDAVAGGLKAAEKKEWQELKRQLDAFKPLHPGSLPVASAMMDLGPDAPATHLLSRGLYDQPAEPVAPGLLEVVYGRATVPVARTAQGSTGRRSALARLLSDPRNPLTARVMVNRVWQHHFGRGLVGTASDFGPRGDRPTHPELLDWLASEFMARGWSLKELHRLIVNSAAYQQSAGLVEASARVDPPNRLLWRYPRHRLEGEAIRDSALFVAGQLNGKRGGPGVFPELPAGMPAPRGGWKLSEDAQERNRRSVYVFIRRNTRYPMFDSFDMPDPHESCARRNVTTSPLQALTLLNSRLVWGWAQGFASRVVEAAGPDVDRQVEAAFRLAYGRVPDKAERRLAREFLRGQRGLIAAELVSTAGQGASPVPEGGEPGGARPAGFSASVEPAAAQALVDLCHMLINANEFVYVN
ncbi:MAG: hypothetical protein RJA22_2207 [Verrucomicrobiota bacterium]